MLPWHACSPLWCDLGFFPNSRGIKAAANLRPSVQLTWRPQLRPQAVIMHLALFHPTWAYYDLGFLCLCQCWCRASTFKMASHPTSSMPTVRNSSFTTPPERQMRPSRQSTDQSDRVYNSLSLSRSLELSPNLARCRLPRRGLTAVHTVSAPL